MTVSGNELVKIWANAESLKSYTQLERGSGLIVAESDLSGMMSCPLNEPDRGRMLTVRDEGDSITACQRNSRHFYSRVGRLTNTFAMVIQPPVTAISFPSTESAVAASPFPPSSG